MSWGLSYFILKWYIKITKENKNKGKLNARTCIKGKTQTNKKIKIKINVFVCMCCHLPVCVTHREKKKGANPSGGMCFGILSLSFFFFWVTQNLYSTQIYKSVYIVSDPKFNMNSMHKL